MELFDIDLKDLKPYKNNSRTHSKKQIKQIVESIREFGWTNPILVDEDYEIIAGHGRLDAAKRLKMEKVPCIVLEGLSEAQKRAYVIADNKLALNAGWNEELLRLELKELDEIGFDLDVIGFDLVGVDSHLRNLDNVDGVEFPELPDGDRDPFRQVTFTLHDDQYAILAKAIEKAKKDKNKKKTLNQNSNGNAIALICEEYLS